MFVLKLSGYIQRILHFCAFINYNKIIDLSQNCLILDGEEPVYHSYYQWIPYLFFIQVIYLKAIFTKKLIYSENTRKGDVLRDRYQPIHRNPVCYPRQNNVIYLHFECFLKLLPFPGKYYILERGSQGRVYKLQGVVFEQQVEILEWLGEV